MNLEDAPTAYVEWDSNPFHGFALMHATIIVHGLPLHLEAIAVHDVGDEWRAVDPELEPSLERLYAYAEPGGPFETARIGGIDYVITAVPYS